VRRKGSTDQILVILGVSVVLLVLGLASNTVNVSDLLVFTVLMALVGGAWKLVQTDMLKDRLNSLSKSNGGGGEINYTFQEGKKVIKDFAEKEFKGRINRKKGISIDHTRSESEPTSIITNPKTGDVIMVRHYYVTHGDLNQPMDFFVDVTNGSYFAHKQVNERRRTAENLNPFEKLDAYRKTRRHARKVRPGEEEKGIDASSLQGVPLGAFPVQNEEGGKQ